MSSLEAIALLSFSTAIAFGAKSERTISNSRRRIQQRVRQLSNLAAIK